MEKQTRTEKCDLFACGFGLVPNVELPLALGCELSADFVKVDRFQQTSVQMFIAPVNLRELAVPIVPLSKAR